VFSFLKSIINHGDQQLMAVKMTKMENTSY